MKTRGIVFRLVVQVLALGFAAAASVPVVADIDVSGAACTSLPDCEDMNPCTLDACVEESCSNHRNPGRAGIECELDRLEDVDICGAELLHAKFRKFLTKKAAKTRRLGQKAAEATKAKKVTKLVTRATRQLQKITSKAAKFARRNKMTSDCKTTVEQRMVTIQQLVSELDPA